MDKDMVKRFKTKLKRSGECFLWTHKTGRGDVARFAYKGKKFHPRSMGWFLEHRAWPDDVRQVVPTCGCLECVRGSHMAILGDDDYTMWSFEQRVVKTRSCWTWVGARNNAGYGVLNSKSFRGLAHRYSYQEFVGELKGGLVILHTCDTPHCVNPKHLVLGTHQQNMADMKRKGRNSATVKLTDSEVRRIRELYDEGDVSQSALARKFGVSQTYIGLLVRGLSRVDASGPLLGDT